MKLVDVPTEVLEAQAVHPPMKLVVDYDAWFAILQKQKWMLIQVNPREDVPSGNSMIKAFNSHVRAARGLKLYTKKLSATDWVVTLEDE